jgi:putative hemolysin
MSFVLVLLIVCFISLSAFLSASETSLFSLSSFQLKSYAHSKTPRLRLIADLMNHPRDVLVTILMLNILANILVQNTVSSLFSETNNWMIKVGVPLALTLVFGELLPKSIAMPNNSAIAYRVSPTIQFFAKIFGPIRKIVTSITTYISRFFFLFFKDEPEILPEELRHVLKTSEESGVLLKAERNLAGGVLDLEQTRVLDHMRPREEILFYDIQAPISTLVSLFSDQGITRVPICEKKLDNLLGILSIRQFFLAKETLGTGKDLLSLLKKPFYIPESTKAALLLKMLRDRKESIAMVVDEYGSITGLITQEDLIEEIVGEIADRRDVKSLYTRSGDDVIIASGKLELADFNQIFDVHLKSTENVVTLGGWLIEQMGTIPRSGEKYATDQFLFYVLAAEPNRVRRIYVRRLKENRA